MIEGELECLRSCSLKELADSKLPQKKKKIHQSKVMSKEQEKRKRRIKRKNELLTEGMNDEF